MIRVHSLGPFYKDWGLWWGVERDIPVYDTKTVCYSWMIEDHTPWRYSKWGCRFRLGSMLCTWVSVVRRKTRTGVTSPLSRRSASGGGQVLKLRKSGGVLPIPEESRYDRLSSESLWLGLEGNLSMSTHLIDVSRASKEPDRDLSLIQTELESAVASVKALRRKNA